ncbi:hypothetical protein ACN5PC_10735, partial [Aliarcobacter butzleri]|uniref:hypothetical protein n=1 Tax=Aliarcobacter butzleri TaxID=28197 RepID=UPI003AF64141
THRTRTGAGGPVYEPLLPTDPVTNPDYLVATIGSDGTLSEVHPGSSGREGAGAEFMEITTSVVQTATHSSLHPSLAKLGISDSQFGTFSV